MKKDIKFSTRMASADREKIRTLAAKAHMSMSDYVTACCLGKRIVVIDEQKLKRDISLIDDILRESKMSEAHLRMLVEKILVQEEDGRLDLEIRLKAPFRDHLDVFENGAQTDCFPTADFDYDRLGAVIYGDYYAG